jgi:CheY-like chemotaxis protein/anti-sigma regulatory factor (Ser/Thr protein kinase)
MSKILVIDDDPVLHQSIEMALHGRSITLCHVTEGTAGLEVLGREAIDLVLLDRDLPGEEGLALLSTLRGQAPQVKIILMAEQCSPETALVALAQRTCDLLIKPFSDQELRQVVESVLEECAVPAIRVLSVEPHWLQLQVPCDLNIVPPLQKLLTQLKGDLPEEIREGIAYAFRELLNNAIEHGGKLDPNQFVEVACIRLKRAILYWIKDPGEGFNPTELDHAAVSNPDHDPFHHILVRDQKGLRAGGFGILLANQMVDELVYNERHNELLFVKYLS